VQKGVGTHSHSTTHLLASMQYKILEDCLS